MSASIEDRFWAKVNKTETCWLWTASKNNMGYGQFGVGSRLVYAHRLAYELVVGPIPEGLELDHLCRVPLCVNPKHLEPVTHRENMRRGESGKHWREKTHCPQGHPYSEENTYLDKRGSRNCRACWPEQRRRRRAKRVAGSVKS